MPRVYDLLARFLDRALPLLLLGAILILLDHLVHHLSGWPSVLSNISAARGLAFVFGIAAALYGLQERSLRRAELQRSEHRIKELESYIEKLTSATVVA